MSGENNFKDTVNSLFKGMDAFISAKTVVGDAIMDFVFKIAHDLFSFPYKMLFFKYIKKTPLLQAGRGDVLSEI